MVLVPYHLSFGNKGLALFTRIFLTPEKRLRVRQFHNYKTYDYTKAKSEASISIFNFLKPKITIWIFLKHHRVSGFQLSKLF